MTIGLRLFFSSVTFSVVIAASYWLLAREITGTFLLGFMALAMCVIAGYMIVAEKEADLSGDDAQATSRERSGELIGSFTTNSILPFWSAFAVAAILLGIVVAPAIAVLGCIAVLVLGVGFIIKS